MTIEDGERSVPEDDERQPSREEVLAGLDAAMSRLRWAVDQMGAAGNDPDVAWLRERSDVREELARLQRAVDDLDQGTRAAFAEAGMATEDEPDAMDG